MTESTLCVAFVPHAEKGHIEALALSEPESHHKQQKLLDPGRRHRPEAAKNGKLQAALSYASFPLDFLSPTLSTSISLPRMQEVNTAGAGARILLNVSRGEGKDQRCLKKRGGRREGGMDRGPQAGRGPLKGGEGMLFKMDSTVCLPSVKSS